MHRSSPIVFHLDIITLLDTPNAANTIARARQDTVCSIVKVIGGDSSSNLPMSLDESLPWES